MKIAGRTGDGKRGYVPGGPIKSGGHDALASVLLGANRPSRGANQWQPNYTDYGMGPGVLPGTGTPMPAVPGINPNYMPSGPIKQFGSQPAPPGINPNFTPSGPMKPPFGGKGSGLPIGGGVGNYGNLLRPPYMV